MLTAAPKHGRRTRRTRPGFTLVEVLVAFTLAGILGAMITRFILTQSRFTDQQNALRGARAVSRQAMNVLESELRMVQDSGGIEVAAADGKTIRVLVPYRFGLICGIWLTKTVVSMLPVDSLSLAQARYAGFAWRSGAGVWQTVPSATPPVSASSPGQCTGSLFFQAGIRTVSLNGRSGSILDIEPALPLTPMGAAVFFFQRVTYEFKASQAFSGQFGLYRLVEGGTSEELIAPFDSTARFKYWTRGATASVAAPPTVALIRGVDVVLSGRSSYVPVGKVAPIKSTVIASIFFRNVRSI